MRRRKNIHINTYYFGETDFGFETPLFKAAERLLFRRDVRKKKINCQMFSISFEETELSWYTHTAGWLRNKFIHGVYCFFTEGGDEFIVFMIKGNPDAKALEMPTQKEDYLADREKKLHRQKKVAHIVPETVEEKVTEHDYRLKYESPWKLEGEDALLFEHFVFSGIDKVLLRAIIKKDADKKVFSDIERLANSIRIK